MPPLLQSDHLQTNVVRLDTNGKGPVSKYWVDRGKAGYLLSELFSLDSWEDDVTLEETITAHLERLMGDNRPFPSEIYIDIEKEKMEESSIREMLETVVNNINLLQGSTHRLRAVKNLADENLVEISAVPSTLPVLEYSRPGPGQPRILLDLTDRERIRDSLDKANIFRDDEYIQMVMGELRVRDPELFVEMHHFLKTMRSLSPPSKGPGRKILGDGSFGNNLFPIQRNIHRFWAGGPMNLKTMENILAMQDQVHKSQGGSTPWRQILWTSRIANENRTLGVKRKNHLDEQLAQLAEAGVEIRDIDREWDSLESIVPGAREKAIGWTREAKSNLNNKKYDRIKWFSDLVRLVAVYKEGGVYMDTDIGPGRLNLDGSQLYHLDEAGEIGMFGPPFRVPEDYIRVLGDKNLGDSPEVRLVRHANESIPALNYFFASRAETDHLKSEIEMSILSDERRLSEEFRLRLKNSGPARKCDVLKPT